MVQLNFNDYMDFNKLGTSKVYNQARSLPKEAWGRWKEAVLAYVPKKEIKTVVDLGCGTGRFLKFLKQTFSAWVFGVDPAEKMLGEARHLIKGQTKIKLLKGTAERVPLPKSSVDLVFISLAFHHFPNAQRALTEILRLLRPGGYVMVRQPTKESNAKEQVLSFFPESKKISDNMVTTRKEMFEIFTGAGFKRAGHTVVKQKVARNCKEFYNRLSLRGASIYKLVPIKIFNKRLQKLAQYCQSLKNDHAFYELRELFVFQKPKK